MSYMINNAVVGVQKSATTWLHECLSEHQELDTKLSKDERYYYGGVVHQEKGDDWYNKLYRNNGNPKVCVSVDYIKDYKALDKLKNQNISTKIVISFRNPIDRLISAYYWYLRKNDIEVISLNDAVKRALNDYKKNVKSNYSDLIERSIYSDDLSYLLKTFDKENIKIILFNQIKNDPHKIINNLFSYFEVNKEIIPKSISAKPKLNTYNKWVIYLQRLAPKSKIMGKITDFINNKFLNRKEGLKKEKKEILSQENKTQLVEIFKEDLFKTNELINNNDLLLLRDNSKLN